MRELAGRTAFVTGGASGIGLALGRAFAEAGMNVMLADIETGALATAVGSLNGFGLKVCSVVCDVADPESVERAARATYDAFGMVHVVCNNAGVAAGGGIDTISLDNWRWVLDVNVMGLLHGVRAFLPQYIERDTEGDRRRPPGREPRRAARAPRLRGRGDPSGPPAAPDRPGGGGKRRCRARARAGAAAAEVRERERHSGASAAPGRARLFARHPGRGRVVVCARGLRSARILEHSIRRFACKSSFSETASDDQPLSSDDSEVAREVAQRVPAGPCLPEIRLLG